MIHLHCLAWTLSNWRRNFAKLYDHVCIDLKSPRLDWIESAENNYKASLIINF